MARSIPDGMTKLVISGTLAGGAETFAFSLWFQGYNRLGTSGSLDITSLDGSAEWDAFITNLLVLFTTGDTITSYDAYWYTGNVAVAHTQKSVSHVGAGSAAILPCQIALVLTFRTALSTRRGRGRIYLPCRTYGVSASTGKLSSPANANTIADKLALFMTSITTGGGHSVSVCSQTGGFATPITSVEVDDVLDTQRRRRASLVGTRHSHSV